jgi:hypothetical protein
MTYPDEGRKAIVFGNDVAKFDVLVLILSIYQPK